MSSVDLVVFDLGRVLSVDAAHLPELARIAGAETDGFVRAYWRHRDAYDLGAPDRQYWVAVAADDRRTIDAGQIAALTELDVAAWSQLHPASLPLLAGIGSAGVATALLSNAPTALADKVRAEPWASLMTALVFSCDIKAVKPAPASYGAIVDRTGAVPERIVFFDDRDANVGGARAGGWDAHLWRGHEDARQVLTRRGVVL